MKKILFLLLAVMTLTATAKPKAKKVVETWPDGTVMDAWFKESYHRVPL